MGWTLQRKVVLGPDGAGETLDIILEDNGYWWRVRAEHNGKKSTDSEEYEVKEYAEAALESRVLQAFVQGWPMRGL